MGAPDAVSDPLAGCEVEKAWSHFGAVPAFAERRIHDSMGWEWAPRALVIPAQTDSFGLRTRCTMLYQVCHTNQQGGKCRVESTGTLPACPARPLFFFFEPLMLALGAAVARMSASWGCFLQMGICLKHSCQHPRCQTRYK